MMATDPLDSPSRMKFALQSVRKCYGSVCAVDDVTLRFEPGRTTALIGSSGSGKSTLLRLLLGLVKPDSGAVLVDGEMLTAQELPALRRRIGYVIQGGGLFPHLTGLENLALLPRYLRWDRDRISARISELVKLVQLSGDSLKRYPAELSGGQRQRVALMRALMPDPQALLLDEPLGSLDPIVRHELQDQLKQIFDALGKTVVLVTHDLPEAAHFASRLVLLREGRVVQEGSFADFRDTPAQPFVREFVLAQRSLPAASA